MIRQKNKMFIFADQSRMQMANRICRNMINLLHFPLNVMRHFARNISFKFLFYCAGGYAYFDKKIGNNCSVDVGDVVTKSVPTFFVAASSLAAEIGER